MNNHNYSNDKSHMATHTRYYDSPRGINNKDINYNFIGKGKSIIESFLSSGRLPRRFATILYPKKEMTMITKKMELVKQTFFQTIDEF